MKKQDYEYIGDDILHVYIPSHYPLRLKLMVLAALKTYKLGNRSIDYMLKKYGNIWAEQFEIACSNCGKIGRFKRTFNLKEDDFVIECHRCGQFFCKNCVDLKPTVPHKKDEILKFYCMRCSGKVKKKQIAGTKGKKRGVAQVIQLDDKRDGR